jgi:hypothetical protein
MAKPKIPNQKKKYQELDKRLNRYVALIEQIYDTHNLEAAKIAIGTEFNADGETPFKFSDYPQTKKRIEDIQAQFASDIRTVIYRGTSDEWKQSNLAQDLIVNKALQSYGATIDKKKYNILYQTNSDALKAFQNRKDKGLNVSAKLWQQSTVYKEGLESAISCALQNGTDAITLSKQISKYLIDFPSLQKDYTEKYGNAKYLKDCEYRSIRLARSEINMAYRTAENERWKQMDFVVGYEIKLSGSHHVPDICDTLAGKYPKDFAWAGWHTNCTCYKIPIFKTEEEFWAWDGKDENTTESVNEVKDVPEAFKKWIKDNERRIIESNSMPYFIRDNSKIVPGIYIANSKRYAESVDNRVQSICKELNVRSTPINIKSDSRIMQKASNDYGGNVSEVMDIVRTTIICDDAKMNNAFSLIENKFSVIRHKIQDFSKENGYTGHLFNIRTSNGTFAEIQVNTAQMIYAKEINAKSILGDELFNEIKKKSGLPHGLGHKYHEEYRILSAKEKQSAKGRELEEKSRKYYESIRKVKL